MSEEECDCCGFSETDLRKWQWRAEEQRDRAKALEARIAVLQLQVDLLLAEKEGRDVAFKVERGSGK